MTKLKDLFYCARPVFFENNEFKEYRYTGAGTCFIIFYDDEYYIVLLQHVIDDYDEDSISILLNEKSKYFIPCSRFFEVNDPKRSVSDYADLRLMRINKKELTDKKLNLLNALDLNKFKEKYKPLKDGDTLVTAGYPDFVRNIDYKKQQLEFGLVVVEGKFIGNDLEKYVFKLKLIEEADFDNCSGFSGSPVFRLNKIGEKYDPDLSGILVRGTASSKLFYFVGVEILYNMLEKLD